MRSFIDNVNDELELQLSLRGFYEKELKCFPKGSLITKKRSNSCCEHYLILLLMMLCSISARRTWL